MSKEELYKLMQDRFEAYEVLEILDISVEELCWAFEDQIEEYLPELKELLNIDEIEEETESTDYDETE